MKKRFRNPNKIDLPHDIDQESLLSLYDRESKDLELFNSIDAEVIKLSGSKLLYYKVFINENYDRVYLEERNKVIAKDPIVVWASFDPKPIEETVSEFGLELTNDQVFVFNKSYVERAIGRAPQPGDVVESPVQNIKYEIYEVQEDSFEVYGVFHYNCYGRVLRDSSDVVDEPALETFEEVGADLVFTRSDYEDLSVAAMTNADIIAPESPPVIVPDPDENILALFANGEVGAWYDPSDSTTVFQDAAGTTPATVGDPVGLILDKSKGLTLGSELVTTTDLAAQNANGTVSINGSSVVCTNTTSGLYGARFNPVPGASIGKNYAVTIAISTNSASKSILMDLGSYSSRPVTSSTGSASFVLSAISGLTLSIYIASGVAGESFTVSLVSVRELPGNHATQSTSAARPVLQQSGDLYYLDFDGVDDSMATTFASAQARPNTTSIAYIRDVDTRTEYIFDGPTSGQSHALIAHSSGLRLQVYDGNASDYADPRGSLVAIAQYNTSTPYRALRLNGSDSSLVFGSVAGTNSWGGIILASSSISNYYLNGRIYSFVGVNRTLTAAEITDLETYLAAKSGVTLATAPIE